MALTPAQIKWLLAAVGTLAAALPALVPALAPYQVAGGLVCTLLGGVVLFPRPGDAPRGQARIVHTYEGLLNGVTPEAVLALREVLDKAEAELAAKFQAAPTGDGVKP